MSRGKKGGFAMLVVSVIFQMKKVVCQLTAKLCKIILTKVVS